MHAQLRIGHDMSVRLLDRGGQLLVVGRIIERVQSRAHLSRQPSRHA